MGTEGQVWWKATSLVAHLQSQGASIVIWTDNDLAADAVEYVTPHVQDLLSILPRLERGLTNEQFDAIERYVRKRSDGQYTQWDEPVGGHDLAGLADALNLTTATLTGWVESHG